MADLRVLSLGAGVQSTTLALMAAEGLIQPPDVAIFADTGWEPRAVYDHLARLEDMLPYPVLWVTAGHLRDDTVAALEASRFTSIPWHLLRADGSRTIGSRQCTNQYKLRPLYRAVRERLGVSRPRPGAVDMLVGISTNEAGRAKPARVQYIRNVFPLLDAGMSRLDCVAFLARRGVMAPKSSCIGCPYRDAAAWRAVAEDADALADAVELDRMLRAKPAPDGSRAFMHSSLKPLSDVDLRSAEQLGQADLFNNECEGMCGV